MTHDFDQFLERMSRLGYLDILRAADQEASRVERSVRGIKSVVRRREDGGRQYVERIGAFLYFMKFGTKPDGASDSDFQKYKHVTEALVERGEMKPRALEVFD